MKNIYTIILAVFVALPANASKEKVLSFDKFYIESRIGQSGLVSVEGVKNTAGKYEKIIVLAFGKSIDIPKNILSKIPTKLHNGILLSVEGGYKELGGKTIYIQFQTGFTSGVTERFIISVNERGDVAILPNAKP